MKRTITILFAWLLLVSPAWAAEYQVKQSSTAYPLVFFMVDSTDHVTGKTGLSPTVTIRKVGGSFATPSGTVTQIANGWYQVAGNSTDSNTLGPLVLHATGSGADPTDIAYEVVAFDPQDSTPTVNAVEFTGSALAAQNASSVWANNTFAINFGSMFDGAGYAGGTTKLGVNAIALSGSTTAANNAEVVFADDFATNYDTTADRWKSSLTHINGATTPAAQLEEAFDNDGTGGDMDLSSLNVTGNTNYTGTTTHTGNVALSNGLTITQATANGNAVSVTGNGTGSGIFANSGGTGSGVFVYSDEGHAVNLYSEGDGKNAIRIYSGGGKSLEIPGEVLIDGPTTFTGNVSLLNGLTSNITGNLSGSVGSVGAGGITSNSFGSGAIDATAIAANAIGSSEVADGAIDAGALAADTITASKVGTGAIDADSLAADAGTELGTANWASTTRTLSAATNITSSGGTITTSSGAVTVGTNNDKSGYVLSQAGLADFFDTNSGTTYASAVAGSVVKEIADHATTPSLTAAGIAEAVLNELLAGHPTPDSLGKAVSDIFDFLDGAPTFADAMDDHEYTSPRALKLDNLDNLDMPVSEVRAQTPSLLVSSMIDDTTVAVTQTSFALAAGPPDDDALNGALVIVTNDSIPASIKKAVGLVKDYDASTKTVTLLTDPGIFTFADDDKVDVIAGGAAIPLWLSGP